MNPSIFIVFTSLFFLSILGNAQTKEEPGMYITESGDTVKGTNFTFEDKGNGLGFTKISYTDLSGQKVELTEKDKVSEIVTVCMAEGYCYDKLYKGKYFRNVIRSIDGKLIVYYKDNIEKHYTGANAGNYTGERIFEIRMPDGKVYKINKANIKEHIKPFLMECEEFVKQYTGDYSKEVAEFKKMIYLYNSLCKD